MTASDLAGYLNNTALSAAWSQNATALKSVFNDAFWVPSLLQYRDNQTTTLCPQDANSFAVLFNLTTSPEQASSVSAGLQKNWNDLGPVAPELPVCAFVCSYLVDDLSKNTRTRSHLSLVVLRCVKLRKRESFTCHPNLLNTCIQLQAHFVSGNDARALDLLQREWGYMLYTNLSVHSTLLEGFTANGSLG